MGSDRTSRLGRRGFLRGVGVAAGVVAVAGAVPVVRARQRPTFSVDAAAFEQEVGVDVPADLAAPAELALVLTEPGGERVLGWQEVRPGETATVRLSYPYRSVVPGEYGYVARVRDAHGATRSSEPLVVTLTRYRFGC